MEIVWLWLFTISFVLQYQTWFSLYNYNNTPPLCRHEQRQFLLQLSQQFSQFEEYSYWGDVCDLPVNYSYKTKYWKEGRDCCGWDGVTCDDSTGFVIGLDLSCGGLSGNIHSNSTLFHLTHLHNLNLAFNDFRFSEISSKFGWLNSLTHLNLSHSGFTGQIPPQFYYLSDLVSLDISSFYYPNKIHCDIKLLFGNMTKIRVVKLPYVNISSEMPINMSSFLTHLDLSFTGLHGFLPINIFERPNLQVLRLGGNLGLGGSFPESLNRSNVYCIKELALLWTSISGRLPDSIGFMNHLKYLELSGCCFQGPIPQSIGNLTQIMLIDLTDNEFSGQVPSTISNLQWLTALYLSSNHLEGQIPNAFSNLQNLIELELYNNSLIGPIPSSLTNMSRLETLDVSSNALTGLFPSATGRTLQKLIYIDLSRNSIKGIIPLWLLSLPSLKDLDLSFNMLSGLAGKFNSDNLIGLHLSNNQLNIEIESFHNLTRIKTLVLSRNMLTISPREVKNVTLLTLQQLACSSCDIKVFPDFLRNSPWLQYLDLSDNKIRGPIPSCLWQNLSFLNLSANYISYAGYLPWQKLEYLNFQSNSLHGEFPSSICNISRLFLLNLSNNKLKGRIPECIGNLSHTLLVLDLRRNQLNGKIPTTIGGAFELRYLGLDENHLEGPLPKTLANCTKLQVLDLGNNRINDTFPLWLETLPELEILILRSNKFHGCIRPPSANASFSELQIIDLSYNNFKGILPEQLFIGLQALRNALTFNSSYFVRDELFPWFFLEGLEPLSVGTHPYQYSAILSVKGAYMDLERLRIFSTIDLSSNNFEGRIPESIAYLYSLRLVNLSHNNINGSIPPAFGQMKNLEQLDLSNNQLTGAVPQTLTNLTFLADLNLSHNHLVGPIPQANQFSTFSNDSYIGNSGLCGVPLTKTCGDAPPSLVVSEQQEEEEDSGFMMGFTWKPVVLGYGCGILIGFILGNILISIERPKWLARFVDTEAAILLNRRKKRGRRAVRGRR